MGAMTASIAHEVNQPLAAIVANANAALRWLARGQPDLTEVRAILKRIVSDGLRASQVVASIRSMFGKNRGETSPLTINDLIDEVLNLVNGELASHRILLRKELCNKLPSVMAERVQIQQVFVNLIMNAIEAMALVEPSRRKLNIVTEETREGCVAVSIRDRGPGMSSNELKGIFSPFFTTKTGGLGLGLSICSTIVTLHKGQLTLRNAPESGVVATVSLPKNVHSAIIS